MSGWEDRTPPALDLWDVAVRYGDSTAVRDVTMAIAGNAVTALIGPSGSGKTTVLRALTRTTDLSGDARVTGRVTYHGRDIYAPDVDPTMVRRAIGLVGQRPAALPRSIYDNVAYGPRAAGQRGRRVEALVEVALRRAGLWHEVKDRLKTSASVLAGGQLRRLCIARALAARPDVILLDEPSAGLDPIDTAAVEDLIVGLAHHHTVVVATANPHQAARVSGYTAVLTTDADIAGARYGHLVEYDVTSRVFTHPRHRRTEAYISGRHS